MRMATIFDGIKELYQDFVELKPDAYTERWFLMGSITPSLVIVAIYLIIVLWLGPIWMEKRTPFNLKGPILVYNAFIVLYCIYVTVRIINVDKTIAWVFYPTIYHTFEKERQIGVCQIVWLYYFAKIIELLDTIFFLLRKKYNQISGLHVFHHCDIILYSWVIVKYSPGLHFVPVFVNTIIHIVMYTYYFIAILGPEYQKYIWWKKYLTSLQLVQFLIVLFHSITVHIRDVGPNRPTGVYDALNALIFLVLFGQFYVKTYTKKPKIV